MWSLPPPPLPSSYYARTAAIEASVRDSIRSRHYGAGFDDGIMTGYSRARDDSMIRVGCVADEALQRGWEQGIVAGTADGFVGGYLEATNDLTNAICAFQSGTLNASHAPAPVPSATRGIGSVASMNLLRSAGTAVPASMAYRPSPLLQSRVSPLRSSLSRASGAVDSVPDTPASRDLDTERSPSRRDGGEERGLGLGSRIPTLAPDPRVSEARAASIALESRLRSRSVPSCARVSAARSEVAANLASSAAAESARLADISARASYLGDHRVALAAETDALRASLDARRFADTARASSQLSASLAARPFYCAY